VKGNKMKTELVAIVDSKTNIKVKDGEFTSDRPCGYLTREFAEYCEDFRQLIPYVVIKNGDKILSYKRSSKSGESRLHDMYSIGFGGHCDLDEYAFEQLGIINIHDVVLLGAERELHEELKLSTEGVKKLKAIGVIKLNDTPVDKVHIGCLMVLESNVDLDKGEIDQQVDRAWKTPAELKEMHLEAWSKVALDMI
jgi:predicted NUDIX family phosphoesterase